MAHIPYEQKLNHKADFRVSYRFYSEKEGGRKTIPFQGYRSDFWYVHPENTNANQLFMIWPEFENTSKEILLDNSSSVPESGTARMWIINPQMRSYHLDKITCGVKGYFMEGARKVGECEVIEILGLADNPMH
jgi:hypothetical protein